jgi:hypothetical protein
MSDEPEQVEQDEQDEQPTEMGQVLEALRALKEAPVAPEPVQAPEPAPEPPPAPTGRVTKAEYEALQRYAAEQRQRAERLELAQEFGIEAGALEGDFDSPADMKRHAEVLALRSHLADLETQLQAVQAGTAEPPAIPNADTGGPTSTEDSRVEEIRRKYTEARAGGRTLKSRQDLLKAIYGDPTRRKPVFDRTT